MSPPRNRKAPGLASEGSSENLISTPRLHPVDPLNEIAAHVDGTFVVVATTGGKYRRRCFLTAAAAEGAATNALATGHDAKVFLAELKPLWRLSGGEVS
jgi:hypothetical protein